MGLSKIVLGGALIMTLGSGCVSFKKNSEHFLNGCYGEGESRSKNPSLGMRIASEKAEFDYSSNCLNDENKTFREPHVVAYDLGDNTYFAYAYNPKKK